MNYLDEMEIYDKLNLLLIKGQYLFYFTNTFTAIGGRKECGQNLNYII